MAKEILIVEDEGTIAGLLSRSLTQKGYAVAVLNCQQAFPDTQMHHPNLVLLDAPPDPVLARALCQHIRSTQGCPLIMLTDSSSSVETTDGIECLPKPVDFVALLAAAETSLKQTRPARMRSLRIIRRGNLILDSKTRLLTNGDKHYRLTPKEFLLLRLFMTKPGQVLTHKLILREVWNTEYDGDIRTLHVHVSWLRHKIEAVPHKPELLRTVRGVGYRFDTSSYTSLTPTQK